MMETVSTKAKIAIEQLLNVHALASMGRVSDKPESYFKAAADWLPKIEENIRALRCELEERTGVGHENSH